MRQFMPFSCTNVFVFNFFYHRLAYDNDYFRIDFLLIGGDQMTAARTRGSKRIRSNSLRGKERLEGLVPVVEDWHAKVCLLGVSVMHH